jgi:hypothetical protein
MAEGSLACFTHWRARFVPRGASAAAAPPLPGGLVGAAAPVPRPGAAPASLADGCEDEEGAGAPGGNGGNVGPAAAAARVASAVPHVQRAAHELQEVKGAEGGGGAAAAAAVAPRAPSPETPALAAARGAAAAAREAAAAAAARPGVFEVEGVEVDVFSEQQLLQAIWVFRGPLDVEKDLFLEQQRLEEAARAASEEAEQAALRAERRAQREAQLQELLAWAVAGQQHLESYVGHWKRQIARQRELLGHRLGSPAASSTASDDGERDG